MKTPQPVFPYLTNCHTSFSDYCKCQPIMVHPTCNTTNSTIAENSWGSKLENVLVNSTWHYLYHPCHIWQMSILNDSSNFWNFYFWKKHCCCGNGGGMYQISSRCIHRNDILLLKLFGPTVRKFFSSVREKKFKAEGREFPKFLRSFNELRILKIFYLLKS